MIVYQQIFTTTMSMVKTKMVSTEVMVFRKKALLVLHVCGFVGGALFCACKAANSLEMLIIGRLIVGYGCGMYVTTMLLL